MPLNYTTVKKLESSNKQPQRRDQQMAGFRSSFLEGIMLTFAVILIPYFAHWTVCCVWDTSEIISVKSIENNISNT